MPNEQTHRRAPHRSLSLALATTLLISWRPGAPQAAATETPAAEGTRGYRAAVEEALAEYEGGRYEEARALFRRAHELEPNARTLRGIGMAAFELRDYVEAVRALDAALVDGRRPLTPDLRQKTEGLLQRAEAFIGRFEIQVEPPSAHLLVDGAPAIFDRRGAVLLGFGRHVVTAHCPGCERASLELQVSGGERQTLSLVARPPNASSLAAAPGSPGATTFGTITAGSFTDAERQARRPDRPYVTLGAALLLAGGAVGSAFWWRDRSDALERCDGAGDRCRNRGDVEREHTLALGTTALTTAGALAFTAAGLWSWSRGTQPEKAQAFRCTPGPAALSCGGRF